MCSTKTRFNFSSNCMGVRDKMLFDRGSQFKAKRTDGSIEELFQGGTRFYKLHRSEQVSVPNKEIQSV